MEKEVGQKKLKDRVMGAVIGAALTIVLMTVIPIVARVSQETITVNFNNIQVAVDGQNVQSDYEPFIFQDRTYLPIRDVANAMGFDVAWDGATNTVHLTSRSPLALAADLGADSGADLGTGLVTAPDSSMPQATMTPQTNQQHNITIPEHITPRPPGRSGGPANPAISAQRAVELARDHLISIGVTNARFDYVYMDIEQGTWVWSVEFDGQGRSYEFYVNVETGAFLKAPQRPITVVTPTPSATPTATPASSPTATPTSSPNHSHNRNNRPTNPAISLERAIEIAYADLARRGITANFRTDSGMDWERGQWVWELEFRVPNAARGRHVIEFYINVDTGAIVKFEQGD